MPIYSRVIYYGRNDWSWLVRFALYADLAFSAISRRHTPVCLKAPVQTSCSPVRVKHFVFKQK